MQTAERSVGSPVGFAAASGSPAERSRGNGQYLCIECNETFDDKLRLSAHRQSHVAKKPFTCSHCGRGFHHQVFLQMHERSHEDGVPGTKLSGSLPAPSSVRGMSTRSSKATGPPPDKTSEEPKPPKPELPINSKVEFKQEKPRCQAAAPVECITRLTRGKAPPACKATDATETRSQFDFRVSTFSDTRVRLIDAFGNSVELLTEVFSSYASAREGGSSEIKTTKMDSGHGARESHISTRPSTGAASPGLRRGDGVPGKSRRSTSRSYQNLPSESARAAQPSGRFPVSGSPAAGHVSSIMQFESSASQESSEVNCGSKQPEVSKVSDVVIPPPSGGDLKQSVVGHKDFPEDIGVQPRAEEMLREADLMDSSEVTKAAGVPRGGASMSGPTLQNSVGDTTPATQESRTAAAAANEKPKNITADIPAERGFRESDVHEGMSLRRGSSGDGNKSIAKEREQLTEAASDPMPAHKVTPASGNGEKKDGESRPEGGDPDPEKVSLVTGDGDVKLPKPDSSDEMLLGGNKSQAATLAVTESPAEPDKPRASETGEAGSQCQANSSSQNTEGTRNPHAEKAGERLGQGDKERGGDVGMSTDISLADRPAQPDGAECAASMNPSLTPERDSSDNIPSPKPEGDDCSDSRAPVPPSESNETVPGDINSEAASNEQIVERDAAAAATREKTETRAQPAGPHIPAHKENILPNESGGEPARADDDIKSDEPGKVVGFTQPGGIMYKDPAFPEKDSQPDGRGDNLTVSPSGDYETVDKQATETLSPPITLSAEGGPTESALSGEPNFLATEQVAADTPESVMLVEESRDVQTIDLHEGKAVSCCKEDLDSSGWKQDAETDLLDDNRPVLLEGSLDVLPHAADDGCSAQVDAAKLDVRSLESSEPSDKERQLSERDLKKYLPQPLETSGDGLPTEQPVDASPVRDSEKGLLEVNLQAGRNDGEPKEGDALAPPACGQRSHGEEVRRSTSHSHGVCVGHATVGDKVNNESDIGSAAAEDRSRLTEGGLLSERLQPQEQAVGKSKEGSHEEQAEASKSTAGLATTLTSGVWCLLCKQKLRSYRGESPALLCYKCRQRRKKEARIPQTDANHLGCRIKQEPCEEGLSDGLTSDVNPHEADAEATKMYNCHKCDQSFKLPALLAGHMKNHSLARCLTCGCQMRVRYKVRRIPRRCQSCVQKIRDKKKKKKELFEHNEAIKEEDGEKWESMNSDRELDGGRTVRPSPHSSSKAKVRKGKLPRSHLVGSEHRVGEPSPNKRNQEGPASTKVASLIRALPKLHKCPECGMSFKRPGFLIKHVRKHALLNHCTCHLLLKKTHKKCLHCREQLKDRRKDRLSSQRAPSKKTAVGSVLQYPSTSLKESAHDGDSDQLALVMCGDVGSRRPKESKLLQKRHGKKDFAEHAMKRRKPAAKAPLPPGAETGNVSQDNPDLCDAAQILSWEEGAEIWPTSHDEEEADEGLVGESLLCKEDVVNDADQLGPDLSDKPHVCPQCGKSFQTYKSLHLHELVHTGEHCESCGCRLRLRKGGGRRSKKCRVCKLQEKGQSAEAKKAIAAKVSTLLGLQKKKKVMSSKGIKSELKKLPKGVKNILVKRLIKKPKKERGDLMPLKKQVRRKKAKESGDDTVTDVSDRVLSSPNSNVELEGKIFAEPAEPEMLTSTTSPESDTEGTSGMSHDPLKKIKGSHKGKLSMLKDWKPEVTDKEGKALPGAQSSLLTDDKSNRCLVCGQSFASPELLCTHRQSHAAELPFACTQCPQRFHKKPLLNIHILTHVKERPHRCPDCNKCFTGLNNLNMHRRVHMGLRPYSCPDCPMSFRHKVSLLVHRYTHTKTPPVELESYRCSFCGKSFVRSDHLEDHQRVHTGDCPFRCQDCDKTFPSQARLAVHSRVHSRVVSHSCPHCERSFINKANLERHQQKHTGELAFSCTECDVRFPSLVMLARHKHSHREDEVFSCIRCAKTFLYKSCLFKHQNVCQGVKKGSNKGQTRGIKRKKSEQAAEQGQTHKRQKGVKKIAKGVKRKKEGKPVKIKMENAQKEEGPSEKEQDEEEGNVPKEEVKSNENKAERGKKKRAEGKPAKAADGKHDNVPAVKVKKQKLLKEGIKAKEPKEGAKAKERKTKDGLKSGEEKVKKSKVGIKRGPYKKKIQIGATGDKKKIVRVKIKGVKLKPGPKKKQGMKDKK